jgi:hypothetical protein
MIDYITKGEKNMNTLKVIEIMVMAATAFLAAVKGIIKLIGYISKFRKNKLKASGC